MASPNLIQGAQAIILCGLCDKENAKWRCIDCDTCICESCRKIHLKVPVTAKHDIVSITTPLYDIKRKIIIDNIPCMDHQNKMMCLFCKTCDTLVCTVCVETKHKGHTFISLEKVVEEKLEKLKLFQSKLDENLKDCGSKAQEINQVKTKYNAIYDNSVKVIQQKEEEMKAAITRYSTELQDKVKVERSKMEKVVTTTEKQIKEAKKNLEDLRDKTTNAIVSIQGKNILEVNMTMPDLNFNSPSMEVKHFIPGLGISKDIKQMEKWFGMLQTVKTFTTDLDCIDQLCVTDETLVWISSLADKVIKTMTFKDNEMTVLKEISIYCGDMAINSDDDILISTPSGVKQMNKSGEIKHFLTVEPLYPFGIHVTSNNDILVGVRDPGDKYILTDKSQRAVIVFHRDGKQKYCFEFDRNKKRLFTVPETIITSKLNQDILVIDRISEVTGQVICLNKDGGLKWTYEGHSPINDNRSLNPVGIVTTSSGLIIFIDYDVDAVHVLSMEGYLLTYQVLADIGIMNPYSLDIDRKGQLWVGCHREDKQSKAKLHIIKIPW